MAYALKLPSGVTALIYSMRDWRLEQVVREGGTPSRKALRGYLIDLDPQFRDSAEHLGGNYTIHHTVGLSRRSPYPNIVYYMIDDFHQIVRVSINTSVFYIEECAQPGSNSLFPYIRKARLSTNVEEP